MLHVRDDAFVTAGGVVVELARRRGRWQPRQAIPRRFNLAWDLSDTYAVTMAFTASLGDLLHHVTMVHQ